MLKNKSAFEMNRDRYIAAGKRDAEQKKHKAVMLKAVKPNKLH